MIQTSIKWLEENAQSSYGKTDWLSPEKTGERKEAKLRLDTAVGFYLI